jgi:hypothetical protein
VIVEKGALEAFGEVAGKYGLSLEPIGETLPKGDGPLVEVV